MTLPKVDIYNTFTKTKQPLTPIHPGKVGFYVCGMTVYDLCHLGHARSMVAFDVAVRYLRSQGYEVTYVRNITDIDDKIIARAQASGEDSTQLVERMILEMHQDFDRLGLLKPDVEPRATQHVAGIIAMVQQLIDKGFAYVANNGDVYYSVRQFTDYGQLSGRQIDELVSGARIDVEEEKQDPLDFALWKQAKPGEPSWDSPWGKGRPGWHIECSVMSTQCLGNHFDIHGGGADLQFPHHENEIAQSEAATGQKYVNTWMHCGPLRINDVKMSKSLGNDFRIREVLTEHAEEVVRLMLMSSHYRSPLNFTEEALKEAEQKLLRFYNALSGVALVNEKSVNEEEVDTLNNECALRFHQAMRDDFNTPEALAALFDLVREVNKSEGQQQQRLASQLKYLGGMLGCLQSDPEHFLQGKTTLDENYIQTQIQKRHEAKQHKDFAMADQIRNDLLVQGIVLQDSREGTTWVKSTD